MNKDVERYCQQARALRFSSLNDGAIEALTRAIEELNGTGPQTPDPYLPDPPPEILNAAIKIQNWAAQCGMKHWKILGIQSRES